MTTFRSVPIGRRRGFTLIELLIVMGIIAILMSLSMAAANKIGAASANTKCKNNLKNIAQAIKIFEGNQTKLPYNDPASVTPQQTIWAKILTGVDADYIAGLIGAPPTATGYSSAASNPVTMYVCPADPSSGTATVGTATYALSSYAANEAVFRGTPTSSITSSTAMTSPSITLMIGERLQNCNGTLTVWAQPDSGAGSAQTTWTNYCVFLVNGVDPNTGQPVAGTTTPPAYGMPLQSGASQTKCSAALATNMTSTGGYAITATQGGNFFQSGHPGGANFARGDGGVITLPSGFDAKSLNYWCLGSGRDAWPPATSTTYATLPN